MESFLQSVSETASPDIVVVTDGQLPLRQCLMPETCTKGIAEPPAVFSLFYDLRKEFRKGFPNAPTDINSIQEMVNRKLKFSLLSFFFKISACRSESTSASIHYTHTHTRTREQVMSVISSSRKTADVNNNQNVKSRVWPLAGGDPARPRLTELESIRPFGQEKGILES